MIANHEGKMVDALQCMTSALHMLDEAQAPGHIASHLDLAICRLENALGHGGVGTLEEQILASEFEALVSTGEESSSRASLWGERESELAESLQETA